MRSDWCSRTTLLLGDDGLKRLENSSVAVIGVGGVGSHAAEALARAGIGRLMLLDSDLIQPSNINRQLHATVATVGQAKVEVMAGRIKEINPDCEVIAHNVRLDADNLQPLLASGFDLIVDAIDSFAAKKALIVWCVQSGIPVISSMGAAGRLDPSSVRVADISKSQGCRLARKLRKELKKEGISKGVMVAYSDEPSTSAVLGEVEEGDDSRRPIGSISYMPAVFGFFLASVAIRLLVSPVEKKIFGSS